MRYYKLLLLFILLLGSKLAYIQSCASIAAWDASNRGGSGMYFTGEYVRLPGGTSYYTPRYGSTTCHLTDGWCRDEASAGWGQWQWRCALVLRPRDVANLSAFPAVIYGRNGSSFIRANVNGRIVIQSIVREGNLNINTCHNSFVASFLDKKKTTDFCYE